MAPHKQGQVDSRRFARAQTENISRVNSRMILEILKDNWVFFFFLETLAGRYVVFSTSSITLLKTYFIYFRLRIWEGYEFEFYNFYLKNDS